MNPKNLFNKLFKKSKYSESDKGLGSNKEKTKLNYDFHKLSLEELSQRFETSLTFNQKLLVHTYVRNLLECSQKFFIQILRFKKKKILAAIVQ